MRRVWLQVIDETLRVITFSMMVFREAKKDVNVCGTQLNSVEAIKEVIYVSCMCF